MMLTVDRAGSSPDAYTDIREAPHGPNTTPLRFYEPSGGVVRMVSMTKTYTPELTPEVLLRLRDYAAHFQDLYRYPTQFSWSGVYLHGLLQDGDRKSIEPMAARVPRPVELLDIRDPEQALQQF